MADGIKQFVGGTPLFIGEISASFGIQNTGTHYVRLLATTSSTPPDAGDFNAGYILYPGPQGDFTGTLEDLFFDGTLTHLHGYAPNGGSIVIYGTTA